MAKKMFEESVGVRGHLPREQRETIAPEGTRIADVADVQDPIVPASKDNADPPADEPQDEWSPNTPSERPAVTVRKKR